MRRVHGDEVYALTSAASSIRVHYATYPVAELISLISYCSVA
ncbi:hypothetical protein [Bacillus sp. Marseille-Q3570]|nr:hypothetical protein [Bacillus sp. Marseille-Q3570]